MNQLERLLRKIVNALARGDAAGAAILHARIRSIRYVSECDDYPVFTARLVRRP